MLGTLSGRLPCLASLKHRVSQQQTLQLSSSSPSLSKRPFSSLTTSARYNNNNNFSTHGNSLAYSTAHLRAFTHLNPSVQRRSISVLDSSFATSSKPLIMFGKANEAYQKSQSIPTPDLVSQTTSSQQTTLGGKPIKRIGSGSFKSNTLSRAQPGPWTKPSTISNPVNRIPLTNGSSNRQHSFAGSVASDTSSRSSVLQSGGFKRALSGASSFTSAPVITERPPSPNLNGMEKLRQAVYFDENDFDDDLSFDFEVDDRKSLSANSSAVSSRAHTSTPQANSSISSYTTIKEDKSAAISRLAYIPPAPAPGPSKTNSITGFAKPVPKEWYAGSTKLPSPVQLKATQESSKDIPSSIPIPWSSSPPEHYQPLSSRTQVNAQSDRKRSSPHFEVQTTEPPAKKGRMLPWMKEQEEAREKEEAHKREEEARLAALKMKEEQKYPMGFKEERLKAGANSTNSKLTTKTPAKKVQPWDMTASAVKVAQKDIKANKKLSTIIADKLPGPKKIKGSVAPLFLSQEQRQVLDMVVEGKKSVFFTGSAGTGKSVLLRELIAGLRRRHARDPDRIAVTASTGLAACNIGGITLHSFAGIGLGRESVDQLVKKIKRNNKAKTRWLRTKVLIIDEISMVDGDLFDKLEGVARSLKNNGRPFGGIQLVVTGDFFQLPPVPDGGKLVKFAFEANTWNTSVDHTIGLTQIFRQKDPVFAGMLNEMRLGRLSPASIEAFRKLSRPIKYDDGLEATELFPTRHEVENANATRLSQLQGEGRTYSARDESKLLDPQQRDKLLSNVMAPPSLTLKVNAQVMLIKNIDDSLVNGSLGRVVGFMDEKTYAMATDNGTNLLEIEDDAEDSDDTKLKKSKIREMASGTGRSDTSQRMPLVQFSLPDGTARQTLLTFESWKIELPTGEVQASRTQLPLILAWAISIHKAQGQTLERVKVDLGKVFEKGQAYVALSRATSQNGLQIMRFDPKRVMAHDKVRSFYESLYSVDRASEMGGSTKKHHSNLSEEEQALLEAQQEIDNYPRTTGQAGRMRAYA